MDKIHHVAIQIVEHTGTTNPKLSKLLRTIMKSHPSVKTFQFIIL